jgi:hypothetical protein
MKQYIDADHIQEWMTNHYHRVLDSLHSSRFERYLNTLPWVSSHVDWDQVENAQLLMPTEVDRAFLNECRKTPWGQHDHVVIMYTGDQDSLLCRTEDAIADLDLLYSRAPGDRFFCGAELIGTVLNVLHEHFSEYDGHARLTYPIGCK